MNLTLRSPALRWFLLGVVAASVLVSLAAIFIAYQKPELLLNLANLRYCV